MSESKGAIGISIKTTARDVCSIHKYAHWDGLKNGKLDRNQFCIGGFIGTSEHRLTDMAIRAFAWGIQLNLLKTNETMQDVTGASNPETANTAISAVNLHAGSGVTAAVFTDFQIESPLTNTGSTAYVAPSINAISGPAFTVTGVFTNTSGGTLTYGNTGIETTLNSHTYLLTHDQINGLSGFIVSNNGTVSITYTVGFS